MDSHHNALVSHIPICISLRGAYRAADAACIANLCGLASLFSLEPQPPGAPSAGLRPTYPYTSVPSRSIIAHHFPPWHACSCCSLTGSWSSPIPSFRPCPCFSLRLLIYISSSRIPSVLAGALRRPHVPQTAFPLARATASTAARSRSTHHRRQPLDLNHSRRDVSSSSLTTRSLASCRPPDKTVSKPRPTRCPV
jgi:hypothetical protein